jgi:hypothetical protein
MKQLFRGKLHAPRSGCGIGSSVPVRYDSSGRQTAPAHKEIAELAYSYWEARGRQGGSAEEDWLRAERELTGRRR